MTSYVAVGPPPVYSGTLTATYQLSLTAVLYQIRIIKIERFEVAGGVSIAVANPAPHSITGYVGTTISRAGGALTPRKMRENAAPASATAAYGTTNYNSGTATVSSSPLTISGGVASVLRSEAAVTSENDYQFPSDYIMNTGSSLVVAGTAVNGGSGVGGYSGYSTVEIYFEELHLARSN